MLCFRNFTVAKKFMDKREWEVSRFSVEKLLYQSAEKSHRATLQGVDRFGCRKSLCFRGLCHDFCRSFWCHSAEILRRGAILCCVYENFRKGKWLWIRRGEYEDFPSKVFCLTMPKNAVSEHFSLSLFFDI